MAEGTASGVPREAFWPGDLAFPQISAPARAPRPLFSPSGNTLQCFLQRLKHGFAGVEEARMDELELDDEGDCSAGRTQPCPVSSSRAAQVHSGTPPPARPPARHTERTGGDGRRQKKKGQKKGTKKNSRAGSRRSGLGGSLGRGAGEPSPGAKTGPNPKPNPQCGAPPGGSRPGRPWRPWRPSPRSPRSPGRAGGRAPARGRW